MFNILEYSRQKFDFLPNSWVPLCGVNTLYSQLFVSDNFSDNCVQGQGHHDWVSLILNASRLVYIYTILGRYAVKYRPFSYLLLLMKFTFRD